MTVDSESGMNIRRFRALHNAGVTYAEIARECGCDWRTVRRRRCAPLTPAPCRGWSPRSWAWSTCGFVPRSRHSAASWRR